MKVIDYESENVRLRARVTELEELLRQKSFQYNLLEAQLKNLKEKLPKKVVYRLVQRLK